MNRILHLSTLSLVLLAASASAQTAPPVTQEQRVDNRQARQESRISQGVESGSLTAREQRRVARQQRGIAKLETRVESDGTVTGREAVAVERAQDRASRTIRHAKHDRQVRR